MTDGRQITDDDGRQVMATSKIQKTFPTRGIV